MKKCVVIPDSFKGSLDSIAICHLASASIKKFFPSCDVVTLPVADGGEGTVDCFLSAVHGERTFIDVSGPYGKPVRAYYGHIGNTAVVEMAQAAGLPLVGDERDPSRTTTYGVGQLIGHAIDNGCNRIVLGLGGSATNDGGCGCAAALGVRFLNAEDKEFVPVGGTLDQICRIDCTGARERLAGCEIIAMCDIENPMHGPNGAAYIFGPQKGANEAMVEELDRNLKALDHVIQKSMHIGSVAEVKGSGAAGAMGAGMLAFLGAELKPGIETVLDFVNFEDKIKGADAVFTGEGRIDGQSLRGKVVIGVARRAKVQEVPVYAIVGDVADDAYGAYDEGVTAMFSINRLAVPFEVARTRSKMDYKNTLEDVLRLMSSVRKRKKRTEAAEVI